MCISKKCLLKSAQFTMLLMIFLSSFLITSVFAQDSAKDKLELAEQLYKSAQFDDAIEKLNSIVSDSSADVGIRKDALRFLGRAYSAKGLYDKAKESITQLLKLEPPMVVFNPDYEPPVFMKLYYESRKEFSGSYAVERPDPGMKTMAIIDFKNRSVDHKEQYDPMEQGFADLMINRMNNSTNLKVIERE